jgi:hypothetical protein
VTGAGSLSPSPEPVTANPVRTLTLILGGPRNAPGRYGVQQKCEACVEPVGYAETGSRRSG